MPISYLYHSGFLVETDENLLIFDYSAGAECFIQELTPRILIPMHFADSPEIADTFGDKVKEGPSKIINFPKGAGVNTLIPVCNNFILK